jgi:hypothetical protein
MNNSEATGREQRRRGAGPYVTAAAGGVAVRV